MENLTITQTIKQLQIWIDNCQFDLASDNKLFSESDKKDIQVQLQSFLIAKANLETALNINK
jgi:hypothetical protein